MEQYICEFCDNRFINLSVLKNHKKRARYCIEIQKKNNIEVLEDYIICNYCSKSFVSITINRHLDSCKIKKKKEKDIEIELLKEEKEKDKEIKLLKEEKDKEIKLLKEEKDKEIKLLNIKNLTLENIIKEKNIKINEFITEIDDKKEFIMELKEDLAELRGELKGKTEIYEKNTHCLHDIAKQPKNTSSSNNTNISTNNKFLNISCLDLSDKRMQNVIDNKFVKDYIHDGQKGVAQFAVDNILTDNDGNINYLCTDPSRQVFKYKDINGEIRKDIRAKKLTDALVSGGIREKTIQLVPEMYTDNTGNVDFDRFAILGQKEAEIRGINDESNDFRKELISMLPNKTL
jgi:hypothetical protein